MDLTHATWRKSSYSTQNGSCVEIAPAPGAAAVAVRDSTDPHGPRLTFTPAAWQAFLHQIKHRQPHRPWTR
jgi:Domain of unknown function (DUF397)